MRVVNWPAQAPCTEKHHPYPRKWREGLVRAGLDDERYIAQEALPTVHTMEKLGLFNVDELWVITVKVDLERTIRTNLKR